jgi:hypothetical protein
MAFELDQDRIAKSLGVISGPPVETQSSVREQATSISATIDTESRPVRNWEYSIKKIRHSHCRRFCNSGGWSICKF